MNIDKMTKIYNEITIFSNELWNKIKKIDIETKKNFKSEENILIQIKSNLKMIEFSLSNNLFWTIFNRKPFEERVIELKFNLLNIKINSSNLFTKLNWLINLLSTHKKIKKEIINWIEKNIKKIDKIFENKKINNTNDKIKLLLWNLQRYYNNLKLSKKRITIDLKTTEKNLIRLKDVKKKFEKLLIVLLNNKILNLLDEKIKILKKNNKKVQFNKVENEKFQNLNKIKKELLNEINSSLKYI